MKVEIEEEAAVVDNMKMTTDMTIEEEAMKEKDQEMSMLMLTITKVLTRKKFS